MIAPSESTYILIVDTDHYASNFERELCAYCTGQVNDGGVGSDEADAFQELFPERAIEFKDLVWFESDEHGVRCPASIWPTPGRYNDGFGGAYDDTTDPEFVRARYEKSVRDTYGSRITITDYPTEIGEPKWINYSRRLVENTTMSLLKRGPGRYPSYESVAIFLNRKPTDDQVTFIKKRATEFLANHKRWGREPDPITIKGFRLIYHRVERAEEEIPI